MLSRDRAATSNCLCRGIRRVTVVPFPTSLDTSRRNDWPNKVRSRRRNSSKACTCGPVVKKVRRISFADTKLSQFFPCSWERVGGGTSRIGRQGSPGQFETHWSRIPSVAKMRQLRHRAMDVNAIRLVPQGLSRRDLIVEVFQRNITAY
jgi:hypothetical protein